MIFSMQKRPRDIKVVLIMVGGTLRRAVVEKPESLADPEAFEAFMSAAEHVLGRPIRVLQRNGHVYAFQDNE